MKKRQGKFTLQVCGKEITLTCIQVIAPRAVAAVYARGGSLTPLRDHIIKAVAKQTETVPFKEEEY